MVTNLGNIRATVERPLDCGPQPKVIKQRQVI
jgi:hypothetical protein